jgi:hypothetical protein
MTLAVVFATTSEDVIEAAGGFERISTPKCTWNFVNHA